MIPSRGRAVRLRWLLNALGPDFTLLHFAGGGEYVLLETARHLQKAGVNVRVLIDDPMDESVPIFKAAGITVKTPPTSIYLHSKLIIADSVAFVGSENMSNPIAATFSAVRGSRYRIGP